MKEFWKRNWRAIVGIEPLPKRAAPSGTATRQGFHDDPCPLSPTKDELKQWAGSHRPSSPDGLGTQLAILGVYPDDDGYYTADAFRAAALKNGWEWPPTTEAKD